MSPRFLHRNGRDAGSRRRRATCHHLKPIDPADYAVTFTAEELARLNAIFAKGVCDWTKRTGEYRPTKGTWASFGPAGFGADR